MVEYFCIPMSTVVCNAMQNNRLAAVYLAQARIPVDTEGLELDGAGGDTLYHMHMQRG